MTPRAGRTRWLTTAYTLLLTILALGLLSDRLTHRFTGATWPPLWLLFPLGLLFTLAGVHAVAEQQRFGAIIDEYNTAYRPFLSQLSQRPLEGWIMAAIGGVIFACLGTALAIIGLCLAVSNALRGPI